MTFHSFPERSFYLSEDESLFDKPEETSEAEIRGLILSHFVADSGKTVEIGVVSRHRIEIELAMLFERNEYRGILFGHHYQEVTDGYPTFEEAWVALWDLFREMVEIEMECKMKNQPVCRVLETSD